MSLCWNTTCELWAQVPCSHLSRCSWQQERASVKNTPRSSADRTSLPTVDTLLVAEESFPFRTNTKHHQKTMLRSSVDLQILWETKKPHTCLGEGWNHHMSTWNKKMPSWYKLIRTTAIQDDNMRLRKTNVNPHPEFTRSGSWCDHIIQGSEAPTLPTLAKR